MEICMPYSSQQSHARITRILFPVLLLKQIRDRKYCGSFYVCPTLSSAFVWDRKQAGACIKKTARETLDGPVFSITDRRGNLQFYVKDTT